MSLPANQEQRRAANAHQGQGRRFGCGGGHSAQLRPVKVADGFGVGSIESTRYRAGRAGAAGESNVVIIENKLTVVQWTRIAGRLGIRTNGKGGGTIVTGSAVDTVKSEGVGDIGQ